MKLITRDTDYAIRSVCYIGKGQGRTVSVKELERKLKISRPFLRKILQILNREGVLESHKGASGGFILRRDPDKIYLVDLMNIFQGPFSLNECLLNKLPCPNKGGCLLRKKISGIEKDVFARLKGISIGGLLKERL